MSCTYDSAVKSPFPRVGLIGAGHIARMMVTPATSLGVDLLLFAQSSEDSGAQITHHVIGNPTDLSALKEFAKLCDVIIIQEDGVPLSAIKGLEAEGVRLYPSLAVINYLRDLENIRQEFANVAKPTLHFDSSISEVTVMVARSPHGQATSWAPTEFLAENRTSPITLSPASNISSAIAERLQQLALEIAKVASLVGVMTMTVSISGESIYIKDLSTTLHFSGNWTIEGARTSQYEQLLRAILDLPLGDPAMNSEYVVTGKVISGEKLDMYRPYLHLMARSPGLKFHQYRNQVRAGESIGHVTALGSELRKLIQDVEHAQDYMSGIIDE